MKGKQTRTNSGLWFSGMDIKLSDVCKKITDGSHNPPKGIEHSDYLMLSSKNVFDDFISFEEPRYLSEEDYINENKRTEIEADDLLMTIVGTVGRAAVVPNDIPAICLQRSVAVIKLDKSVANSRYMMYQIQNMRPFFESEAHGVAQKGIYLKQLANVTIQCPHLDKQHKIVSTLDKLQSIITHRKQQLAKLDELVKARFVEMFGDPDLNPMGWEESHLSEKLDVLGGYAFKSDEFDEETGIPVLRIGNINAGFFRPVNMVYWREDENLEKYAMYPGDLVMSLTGTVGKDDYGNVCILGKDYDKYYLNQRNAKLEIKEGLAKLYLSEILKFDTIKKRLTGISRGVRQANIANRDILNLYIPIPPLDLQNQFAAFVEQTDKSKVVVQKALDEAQLLFDSLMQEYFG